MSCFLVNPEHINVLIWAARNIGQYEFTLYLEDGTIWNLTHETMNQAGQWLLEENVASVNHKYSEDNLYIYSFLTPRYFQWEPVEILKAISCYEYQACESPGWQGSLAKKFCDKLRNETIANLSGWQEADTWDINPHTKPLNA